MSGDKLIVGVSDLNNSVEPTLIMVTSPWVITSNGKNSPQLVVGVPLERRFSEDEDCVQTYSIKGLGIERIVNEVSQQSGSGVVNLWKAQTGSAFSPPWDKKVPGNTIIVAVVNPQVNLNKPMIVIVADSWALKSNGDKALMLVLGIPTDCHNGTKTYSFPIKNLNAEEAMDEICKQKTFGVTNFLKRQNIDLKVSAPSPKLH